METGKESYLDVTKSVIISSPAGSGKTEKLARRYISLLSSGSEVEKILCITFTEKAAAEMKQRILGILEAENPELLAGIRDRIPLMRISTIHAFCLKLLKRFSIELGLDPSLQVMDELTARALWLEALYEGLMAERESPSHFSGMIKERGIRGWSALKRLLDELHARRPYPEMILREGHPLVGEARQLVELYGECLLRYKEKKSRGHLLDFEDLELMAYETLSRGPEWHNILYSFDEHTDHVLVDEFQDTSTLQWRIIDKLTEEWRSGAGAKREQGKTPTIFLVGDEKQSIYQFRGANASVYEEAKQRLGQWLGEEYRFVEVKENYRSLPAIIDFTNALFEKLMPQGLLEHWRSRYSPFEAVRQGQGRVELILLDGAESTKEARTREAHALARTIKALHGSYEVYDGEVKRPSGFKDMAVLLRKRTHLGLFEDALRKEDIPFVVLKGIGLYDEPEVAVLRELVSFLVDPADDYSLFCVLRSPLFSMGYKSILRLLHGETTLLEKLRASDSGRLKEATGLLGGWLDGARENPLSVVLERALSESGGWKHFWEKQRHANIKKFISLVESFESQGLSPLEIREKLLRQRHAREVSKANINAEGVDAVRIMTVHAAKGLQFPMVFIPSLEESISPWTGPIAIDDEGGRITLGYEEDSSKRDRNEIFRRKKQKDEEEEKRLFYVAVTRARDYLCMLGSRREEKTKSRLAYLEEAFGPLGETGKEAVGKTDGLFTVLREGDLAERAGGGRLELSDAAPFVDAPAYTDPLSYQPPLRWRDVTEDLDIRTRHGDNWVVVGSAMHRIFEELSRGILREEDIPGRAELLLRTTSAKGLLDIILKDIGKLRKKGYMKRLILPRDNSYTELPFVLEKGKSVFKGRIDRLIIEDGIAMLYDYKTFPVKGGEMPLLIEKYRFQMELYREAVERLFSLKARAFLVFTHTPEIVEL